MPLLAHWGWQAALYDGAHQDAVRPVHELVGDVLAPSAAQGADLFELTLSDAHHGAPISWSDDDPIEQPPSWRGAALEGGWSGGLGELATEAHARGVLLFGGFDVMPVGDRPVEQLVALRMHARELAGARRLSAAAFDGFGVREALHEFIAVGQERRWVVDRQRGRRVEEGKVTDLVADRPARRRGLERPLVGAEWGHDLVERLLFGDEIVHDIGDVHRAATVSAARARVATRPYSADL